MRPRCAFLKTTPVPYEDIEVVADAVWGGEALVEEEGPWLLLKEIIRMVMPANRRMNEKSIFITGTGTGGRNAALASMYFKKAGAACSRMCVNLCCVFSDFAPVARPPQLGVVRCTSCLAQPCAGAARAISRPHDLVRVSSGSECRRCGRRLATGRPGSHRCPVQHFWEDCWRGRTGPRVAGAALGCRRPWNATHITPLGGGLLGWSRRSGRCSMPRLGRPSRLGSAPG